MCSIFSIWSMCFILSKYCKWSNLSMCSMRSISSKYYAWCIFSMCSTFCIFSMCSACFFSPVPFFPTTTLGSNHSKNFCRFEVVLIFRGDVGLMIILKSGYILHKSNTQRKYASSDNSVSSTLHIRISFHQQSTFKFGPQFLPHVHVHFFFQFNGRAPAQDNSKRHI
jgi:hypothetical protein